MKVTVVTIIALTAALSGTARGQASEAGGSISGAVSFDGKVPVMKKLAISKALAACDL
ncbi:uncharacterized protein METZ01_LOCUS517550, partial [marine metagenome]